MDRDELQSIRSDLGMTQKQLAEALGLKSALSVSHMETGFREISDRTKKTIELLQKSFKKRKEKP